MATPEDWLKSTTKQRQDMYRAVHRLIRLGAFTWDELYVKALGRVVSSSFNENFRKGRQSAPDAVLIYRFLQETYPDAAMALDAEAFAAKAFTDFLLRFRRLGMVSVLPELMAYPVRVARLGPEWAEYPFEVEDPVRFRVRLPFIYQVVIAINGCESG